MKKDPQQKFDDAFAMIEYLLARVDTPNKPEMVEKLNRLIIPHILGGKIGVKDAQIIEDAKNNGTPIFVLTAKDKNSVEAMYDYHNHCITYCKEDHLSGIYKRISEFEEWQENNPDKVKFPD